MSDQQIASRYEKWMHIISISWFTGTAVAALILDVYSYTGMGCWISFEPLRCTTRDGVQCARAENAYWLVRLVLFRDTLIMIWAYIIYTMVAIYRRIKQISDRAAKINFEAIESRFSVAAFQISAHGAMGTVPKR